MSDLQAFRAGDGIHFILGDVDGYGWCDIDPEDGTLVSGGIEHAPTDEAFVAIAEAIDDMSDDDFLFLCVNAQAEEPR